MRPLHLGASDVVQPPSFSHHGGPAWQLGFEVSRDPLAALLRCCPSMPTTSWRRRRPIAHREKIVERLLRALTDINAEGQAIRRPQTFGRLVRLTGIDATALGEIADALRAEGASFLTPFGFGADRRRHVDRHQPRGADTAVAADCRPARRLAGPRVPGRADLAIAPGSGRELRTESGERAVPRDRARAERLAVGADTSLERALRRRMARRAGAHGGKP